MECIYIPLQTSMLEQLTSFINAALAGMIPKEILPLFASCRLIALQKSEKKGYLRPIAIGNSLRRIIAKCAFSNIIQQCHEYFVPNQMGVGIPAGLETVIHAVRDIYVKINNEDEYKNLMIFKVDFCNAFNLCDRKTMLNIVRRDFPQIYKWTESMNRNKSPPCLENTEFVVKMEFSKVILLEAFISLLCYNN